MADFIVEDLTGSRFERADLSGSEVVNTSLSGGRFRNVNLTGSVLRRRWDQTVARARRLPPELLHEQVDGEWSFTETLRHLMFATDAWIRRAVHGDPSPWHPLGLPWDEMPDTPWECLRVVLSEQWEHRRYAERDLTVLETRP